MKTGERMKARRKELGLSAETIAERLGVSPATIYRYENGYIEKLPVDRLVPIAEALSTTPAYLMGWDETTNISPVTISRQVRRINVLGSVPAGIPTEAVEDIIDWEELPEEMFSGGREYFGLKVSGDSMFPDILDGDIVIIHKTPVCESGSVAVVYINGYDATLKQVKFGIDGSITLTPRNPNYPPRTYSPKEVAELPVMIAGVVVELRRKLK